MAKQKGKVVFSTKVGDLRKADASLTIPRSLAATQQTLKIMRETKGRKGKVVTVIYGFVLTPDDLKELAKSLKSLCGSGGTAKYEADNQIIEIQGDHRERVAEKLQALGYKVKFAGG